VYSSNNSSKSEKSRAKQAKKESISRPGLVPYIFIARPEQQKIGSKKLKAKRNTSISLRQKKIQV